MNSPTVRASETVLPDVALWPCRADLSGSFDPTTPIALTADLAYYAGSAFAPPNDGEDEDSDDEDEDWDDEDEDWDDEDFDEEDEDYDEEEDYDEDDEEWDDEDFDEEE